MIRRNHRGGAARRGTALLTVVLLPVLATGCSVFESKKVDYKAVQRNKPLDLPPELSSPGKDDRYTVSELGSKGTTYSDYLASRTAKKVDDSSGPVPLLPNFESMRIERAGTQRWLVLQGAPDKVWPVLKQFVDARGLKVKLESVETGILETDWEERNLGVTLGGIRGVLARGLGTVYDTGERDKYRFRLEPGIQSGTTEVHVSYRGAEEVYVAEGQADTRWQPRPADPEREAEMLLRLMSFVGLDEKKAKTVLANAPADTGKVRIVEADGRLQLEIDERFDRSWRRVGLVLDRNGFTVEDRDRKAGEYFVKYDDPVADKKRAESSFWSSLAFWRDKEKLEPVESSFRILVKGSGEESARVQVLSKEGAPLSSASARRILDLMVAELK
jgi:outer membrane protein assembly factor BamC